MKSSISLPNRHKRDLPPEFQSDDVRYTEELVEYFLREFTQEGAVVFDPFMGFGTTLLVSEQLNRICYGIEYDRKRWQYVQTVLKHPERAILGDSLKLEMLELPPFHFSMTSPPYMGKHHKENPFTAYSTEGGGYDAYLQDLKNIYRQVAAGLKPEGRAVVEVSNLKHEDGSITTLAWDIARALSEVMRFEGEVVANWEGAYGYGKSHSYCLIFSRQ